MIVRLRKGFQVKTDAETIYTAIEAARDKDGNIELQTVFENAKPKDAPLHDEFEWNKTKAWEAYNLDRARKLVQSIEVIRETPDAKPTRAWESVTYTPPQKESAPAETRKVFRRTDDIMADPVQRDELLVQALRDAAAYRKRYSGLQELAQVFHAIDDVLVTTKAA